MAGKYQRPQIMPPKGADMSSMQNMGKYMEKHAKRVNDAFAEVYAMLSELKEENKKLKETMKGAQSSGE